MSDEPTNGKPIEEQHPRQITHIVIPFEVYRRLDLLPLEKLLYCEIHSLSRGPRGCWATNKYLGKFLNCTDRHVRRMLQRLHQIELLTVERETNPDTGQVRRILRTARPWDADPAWNDWEFPRDPDTDDEPTEPTSGGKTENQTNSTSQAGGVRGGGPTGPGGADPQVRQIKYHMIDSGTPLPPFAHGVGSLPNSPPQQDSLESAAAALSIYNQPPANTSLNEQATSKENAVDTDSPLLYIKPEQQQACGSKETVLTSTALNVSNTVHARASTDAGRDSIEADGVGADSGAVVRGGVGGGAAGGGAAGADGVAAVSGEGVETGAGGVEAQDEAPGATGGGYGTWTEEQLDAAYRRVLYGREKGERDAVGAVEPGDGLGAADTGSAPGGELAAAGALEVSGDGNLGRAVPRVALCGGAGDAVSGAPAPGATGNVARLAVDDAALAAGGDSAVSVPLTEAEEWEGAAGLLQAFAGPALSAEDALEVTRGRTMARVLEVIGRAGDRPEGMRVGFALKALREGLSVSAPARASPQQVEHRREREEVAVENGVRAGEVTAPPVSRREVAEERTEEERRQMDALKAQLLSSMSRGELAWVSARRQERASFGKVVAEKAVEGLTPLKLIVQEFEAEHEPRDHLVWRRAA